jgi:hypothetical protein
LPPRVVVLCPVVVVSHSPARRLAALLVMFPAGGCRGIVTVVIAAVVPEGGQLGVMPAFVFAAFTVPVAVWPPLEAQCSCSRLLDVGAWRLIGRSTQRSRMSVLGFWDGMPPKPCRRYYPSSIRVGDASCRCGHSKTLKNEEGARIQTQNRRLGRGI